MDTNQQANLFERDALLAGLPARRAAALLFLIESRTARLLARSRQATDVFLGEQTAQRREMAFVEAFSAGREPPVRVSIQALERYAPQWAPLIPDNPRLRAALARRLGEKYRFTAAAVPRIRAALGLADPAVGEAYQRLYRQPLDTIFARRAGAAERMRWMWARLAAWLEELPPFWTAYALTLTETVGATVLALPIAAAQIGPLAGVVLLVVLGLVNMLTIACMSEAVARSGSVRNGAAFTARMVADYLGRLGSSVFSLAVFTLCFLMLQAYYLGFATTMAGATHLPAPLWIVALCLAGLFFVRRESLNATIASALVIGLVIVVLLLLLSLLGLAHLQPANLLFMPLLGGQPLDASLLHLIFGVILTAYFGHLSVSTCGGVVMGRDPSGRSLLWGTVAAQATAMLLFSLFVVAVNGAVAPEVLAAELGTALMPLAATVGPAVHVLGSLFATLSLGMASIHFSLALFNLTREWLAARTAFSAGGSRWLAASPIVAACVCAEALLLTGFGSFTGLLSFVGVVVVSLLAGVFPVLLLIASRRRGELVPGVVYRLLGHPLLLGVVYLIALGGVLLHGLLIWDHALLRAGALFAATLMVVMSVLLVRGGMFRGSADALVKDEAAA
jgi:amino acid permease